MSIVTSICNQELCRTRNNLLVSGLQPAATAVFLQILKSQRTNQPACHLKNRNVQRLTRMQLSQNPKLLFSRTRHTSSLNVKSISSFCRSHWQHHCEFSYCRLIQSWDVTSAIGCPLQTRQWYVKQFGTIQNVLYSGSQINSHKFLEISYLLFRRCRKA